MLAPTVLVTGASSGIGRAIVATCATRGWRVAAVTKRHGRLDAVVDNAGTAVDAVFAEADDATIRGPFRIPMRLRKILPEAWFLRLIRRRYGIRDRLAVRGSDRSPLEDLR